MFKPNHSETKRTKHREYRTNDRLEQVEKNTTPEYGDRQYKPGDKTP